MHGKSVNCVIGLSLKFAFLAVVSEDFHLENLLVKDSGVPIPQVMMIPKVLIAYMPKISRISS